MGGVGDHLADLVTALLAHAEDEPFLGRVLEKPLDHAAIVCGVVVHARRGFGVNTNDMAGAIRGGHGHG